MLYRGFGLLGFAMLSLAACSETIVNETTPGTSSSGATNGSTSGTTGATSTGSGGAPGSTSGTAGTTGTGPIPGACQPAATAPDSPGVYGIADFGNANNYLFFKRDDANNRCMLMYVSSGVGPAYGLEPSGGFGVKSIILTNSAADCPLTYVYPFPAPAGQTVEASCGNGSFDIEPADGAIEGQIVTATFEFPPTYAWVPASDTYCVVQNCCGAPTVTGC